MLKEGEKLIALHLSWDGADVFTQSGKSFWPVFVSIMNLPEQLRDKIFFGLHLLALDDGSICVWETVVEEFNYLWRVGVVHNGIRYRVAIIRVTLDGPGLQKLTCTQKHGSYAGCNQCHYPTVRICDRHCFLGCRRHLPAGDSRRNRKRGEYGLQFHNSCRDSYPSPRTYSEYLKSGIEARNTGSAVDGVRDVWMLNNLDYGEHIDWDDDLMHILGNVIKDSCKVFKPSVSKSENRTALPSVKAWCEQEKVHNICGRMRR
jgi:hypothetical protein